MSTSTTSSKKQKTAEAIALRISQRRADFERNVPVAELLKKEGNELFKAGDYEGATESYLAALRLNRQEPNLYSNLAAAKIKLNQYEQAAESAEMGLVLNPRHMKARYRRLQARKSLGLHRSALYDAEAMLRIDPTCEETKIEVEELKKLLQCHPRRRNSLDDEDDWPGIDDCPSSVIYPEDYTDSEDSKHFGNNVPCKYYNHAGCMRGNACAFSHAPDDMSVRDRLGKNVCIFFILGTCKFGQTKCNYSHSNAALAPTGWWTDPEEMAEMADCMKFLGKSGVLKARLAPHSGPSSPQAVHLSQGPESNGTGKKKGKGKGKGKGKKTKVSMKRKPVINPLCDDEDDSEYDEYDERLDNFGFKRDELNELLCQGVKPWDHDAWDVLAVLKKGGF